MSWGEREEGESGMGVGGRVKGGGCRIIISNFSFVSG